LASPDLTKRLSTRVFYALIVGKCLFFGGSYSIRLMMLLFLPLWLLATRDLAAPASTRNRPVDFSLVVANCFQGDTVAITLNGQALLTGRATSDASTGVTGIGVYQDRKGLWTSVTGETTRYPRLDLHQRLQLRIVLNGQPSSHVVDLRRGWVIFVNACAQPTGSEAPARRLTLQQYRQQVTLE
jgi:hypothetical protein